VDELQAVLDYACRPSFRQAGPTKKVLRHKSVPWWASRLKTQRKEVNAKRRSYQRTKENNELREQRREQYLASKADQQDINLDYDVEHRHWPHPENQ